MSEDILSGEVRIVIDYRLRMCPAGKWLRWLVPNETQAERKRLPAEWIELLSRQWGVEFVEAKWRKVTADSLVPRYANSRASV